MKPAQSADPDDARLDGVPVSILVDDADGRPVVARARDFARDVLRPAALRTDRDGVSVETVDGLRAIGLLNQAAPAAYGGADVDRQADRRIHEHVAAGCFNTWLVWAQHQGRVAWFADRARRGEAVGELGQRVLRGEVLTGTAISDVRHYPDRYVRATEVRDGWRLHGSVSWVSGWGLNALLTVAAIDPTTETQLLVLVPTDERLRSEPLQLAAATGSRTRRVILDDVFVPEHDVVSRTPRAEWERRDLDLVSDVRSQVFGVARTVLQELAAESDPGAQAVAETWGPRFTRFREEAYGLADRAQADPDGPQQLEQRLALKVEVLESLRQITDALLISRGGRGLLAGDTAQLHARSALFLQVQGQNRVSRAAQLRSGAR